MQTLNTISLGQARILTSQMWKFYNKQASKWERMSYSNFLIEMQPIFLQYYGFNYCEVIGKFVFAENHVKFNENPENFAITNPAQYNPFNDEWFTAFLNAE